MINRSGVDIMHPAHRSHAAGHSRLERLVVNLALGDECGHLLRVRIAPQRGSRDLRLALGSGLARVVGVWYGSGLA